VILFPWVYTIYMSLHEWRVGFPREWVGLDNYVDLYHDSRFREAIGRTFIFTAMAVVLPVLLGVAAAVIFHQEFRWRGLFRVIFMMPMIATPVAIALVWTMMFHPQLGVLNYLLSQVGLPPSLWVYSPDTVIPSLVLPFIMVAVVLRTIDALKAFDTIFAITQGGPGTASETINIYLYLQAFSFYRIGHASAVVVVFFAIIVACSLVMLSVRQKTRWS